MRYTEILFIGVLLFLCCAKPTLAESGSLHEIEMQWTDNEGREVTLKNYAGKEFLLTMVYTRCPHVCPVTMNILKRLKADFARAGRPVSVAAITFDPEADDVKKLSSFKETYAVGDRDWHLLRGSMDDTRALAALLGINFSKDPQNGLITHSSRIVFVSSSGEIVSRLDGLQGDTAEFVERVVMGEKR